MIIMIMTQGRRQKPCVHSNSQPERVKIKTQNMGIHAHTQTHKRTNQCWTRTSRHHTADRPYLLLRSCPCHCRCQQGRGLVLGRSQNRLPNGHKHLHYTRPSICRWIGTGTLERRCKRKAQPCTSWPADPFQPNDSCKSRQAHTTSTSCHCTPCTGTGRRMCSCRPGSSQPARPPRGRPGPRLGRPPSCNPTEAWAVSLVLCRAPPLAPARTLSFVPSRAPLLPRAPYFAGPATRVMNHRSLFL